MDTIENIESKVSNELKGFSEVKNKNLIILNGQLKYYKYTLPYWKKFSEINDCYILIISQLNINYKDQQTEKVNPKILKKYLGNYTFIQVTKEIDNYINLEIDILEKSIIKHNKQYNNSHDLHNYSNKNYLKRCFYRQLSTLYFINNMITPEQFKNFDRVLYARSDFLIYDSGTHFVFKNGYLYDYQIETEQLIEDTVPINKYTVPEHLSIPDIRSIHNFSISDFTYWCSGDILLKYLTAYIHNFYKYSWPDNKVCPSVEGQANQARRHLNDTLEEKEQLWDINDFSNNFCSFNFYYNLKKKRLQVRLHRVKTKENYDKLTRNPISPDRLNQKSSKLITYSFFDNISHTSLTDSFLNLNHDFSNIFEKLDETQISNLKSIVKDNNLIIKLNMDSFMLEHKSLNYRIVNPEKFIRQSQMTILLLELLTINPNLNIIIHTIDLHRMNWEIFLYYIKLLKIKYIFFMYCPWFVRKIMSSYQNSDYDPIKGSFDKKKKMIHYYQPNTFKMIFYPRYLWKTRGILEKLCAKLNIRSDQIFNQPKEYDILFYGCIKPRINPDLKSKEILSTEPYINFDEYYQFRKRLYNLLKSHDALQKYNIKIIEWVSKCNPSGTYDTDLFEMISKSKYTIVTNANVQYMVRKYYEVPMSGSIMMGNVPDYAPTTVKPNMVSLLMSMSDKEIISKITHAIDNYQQYKTKQHLGLIMHQVSKIYNNDNGFITDIINYHQTKIKTKKLNEFINLLGIKDLEKLPLNYQQDY